MARPDKVAAVAELQDKFTNSAGAVLTEYRGLTVKALKELRRSLGDEATYAVSKNTLTTIAARQAGIEGLEEHLVGPTAIAFIDGDPVTVAKGLRDFGRTNPLLIIKGGILEGRFLSPDDVRQLADLESREVLLAKVAGGLQGVLQQAVSLFAAPLSQAARTLAALESAAADDPALLAQAVSKPDSDADLSESAPEPLVVLAEGQVTDDAEEVPAASAAERNQTAPAVEENQAPPAVEENQAAPAVEENQAAPAAEEIEAAPVAVEPDAAAAAEQPTTVAAAAAEDN